MNSKIKYNKIIYLFYIILLLFIIKNTKCDGTEESTYNKVIGASCSSNLECNSACCSSDKCSETSKCEKLVTIVYVCEAALCFLFIVGFTIYLIVKLRRIKKDFQEKANLAAEENEDEKDKQKDN